MGYITICDICQKNTNSKHVKVTGLSLDKYFLHYCHKCWTNPKNFKKIHELKKEKV